MRVQRRMPSGMGCQHAHRDQHERHQQGHTPTHPQVQGTTGDGADDMQTNCKIRLRVSRTRRFPCCIPRRIDTTGRRRGFNESDPAAGSQRIDVLGEVLSRLPSRVASLGRREELDEIPEILT